MEGVTSKLDTAKLIHNELLIEQLTMEINLRGIKILMIKYPSSDGLLKQRDSFEIGVEKTKQLVKSAMDMILELTKDDE